MSICLTCLIKELFLCQLVQPKFELLIVQLDPSKFHVLFVSKLIRVKLIIILNKLFIIGLYVSY